MISISPHRILLPLSDMNKGIFKYISPYLDRIKSLEGQAKFNNEEIRVDIPNTADGNNLIKINIEKSVMRRWIGDKCTARITFNSLEEVLGPMNTIIKPYIKTKRTYEMSINISTPSAVIQEHLPWIIRCSEPVEIVGMPVERRAE